VRRRRRVGREEVDEEVDGAEAGEGEGAGGLGETIL